MEGKIVYTYVVADLLHIGHVSYLENAKTFAGENGKLIVGVLTEDATIEKKPKKPVLSFSERIRLVKALTCVDTVIVQETYSPIHNILRLKPDILIESDSHTEADLNETKNAADSMGCKVIILPYYKSQSSSKIKEKIINHWKDSQGSSPVSFQDNNQNNKPFSDLGERR